MKKPLQLAALLCGIFASSALLAAGKEPGFRFANGWTLTPVVSAGVYWESNVHDTAHNEESGGGWRVQPTLSLNYTAARTRLGINAFYTLERGFDNADGEDSDSYGVSIGLVRELTQRLNLSFSASYSHTDEDEYYGVGWDWNNPDLGRISSDETDSYNVNAALGWVSASQKWQGNLGAGFSHSEYDDYDNDTTSYNLSAQVGRAIGPHTYWNVSLSGSIDDPDDGDKSVAYYIMTGISGQLSEKLSYTTLVGLGIYDFEGADGYRSDTEYGPSYSASLSYKINRTFALALSLNSRYEAEYNGYADCYYVWSHNLTGAINAQWTDTLSSSLRLSAFYEEHIDGGDSGFGDTSRTYYQIAFSSAYKFNRYLSLTGSVSWKTDDYDDGETTDNLRADIGLTFTF